MSDTVTPMIGFIGGSGVYDLDGLEDRKWVKVRTPWGDPSDEILTGTLHGVRVAFLPRHGRGHPTPPSALNYRANIDAMKRIGCTELISLSAVGSLKEELPPGHFVIVDQFIDRTFDREKSFFGLGCVAHVSMAHPVCARLAGMAAQAGREAGARVLEGGTYLAMEGPQFSTKAESELYRQWGCDVIGMTNMPEAKLAREAELCYASVAMVTDYDCWRDDVAHVEVADILAHLSANAEKAKALVRRLAAQMTGPRPPSPIDTSLDGAIVTDPSHRDPDLVRKLSAVAGRVLK